MSLQSVTTPVPDGDGFTLDVPDGWQQGRGAYGGLVLASLVRALEAHPDARGRPLRSLSAAIPAPTMVGRADLRVERLRAGTGVSTLAATLSQDGGVCAHVVGVLGRDRTDDAFLPPARPMPSDWRSLPPIRSLPGAPTFTQHFEWRLSSHFPYSGGPPETLGWIKPIDAGPARDRAYLTALADTWWPGMLCAATRPRGSATVSFFLQFCAELDGLDPEAPLLHVGRAEVAANGYVHERRELWGEDGRLLTINQQTFAMLG